ncbi:MAG: ribulose-phosphate 3-epimerase, partial [Arcobacteraceae bacterium]
CLIEVDGGVSDKNIYELRDAGVDVVVAGSYVFGSGDYKKAIESLKI